MSSTLLQKDEVHKKMMAVRLAAQQQALSATRVERQERQLEHRRLALDDRQQQQLLSAAVGPEAALAARSQRCQQQSAALADVEQRAFEEIRSRRLALTSLEAEMEESKSANCAVERLLEDATKTLLEASRMAEDQRREEENLRLETIRANLRQKELDVREVVSVALEATLERVSGELRQRNEQDCPVQEVVTAISNDLLRNTIYMRQLSELAQAALQDPLVTGVSFKDRCYALNLREASPYSFDQASPSCQDDRFDGGDDPAPLAASPFEATREGQGLAFFEQTTPDEVGRFVHCRSSPGRLPTADEAAPPLLDLPDSEGVSTQTEPAVPSLTSGRIPPLITKKAVGPPTPAASPSSAWSQSKACNPPAWAGQVPAAAARNAIGPPTALASPPSAWSQNKASGTLAWAGQANTTSPTGPPVRTVAVPTSMGGLQGTPTNAAGTPQRTVVVGGGGHFTAAPFPGTSPGYGPSAPMQQLQPQRPMMMQQYPPGQYVRLMQTGPAGSSLRTPSSHWATGQA